MFRGAAVKPRRQSEPAVRWPFAICGDAGCARWPESRNGREERIRTSGPCLPKTSDLAASGAFPLSALSAATGLLAFDRGSFTLKVQSEPPPPVLISSYAKALAARETRPPAPCLTAYSLPPSRLPPRGRLALLKKREISERSGGCGSLGARSRPVRIGRALRRAHGPFRDLPPNFPNGYQVADLAGFYPPITSSHKGKAGA